MAIEVTCPGCKKRYRVKEELAGKALRCKACQSVVKVPAPNPEPAPLTDLLDEGLAGFPAPDPLASGTDPLGTPLTPAAPRRKERKPKTKVSLPNLGIWWPGAAVGALVLLLWLPAFVSKNAAGMAVFLGVLVPIGLLGIGLLGMAFRIVKVAGSEGSGALFHVLFWTRSGRRFAYANWREYKSFLFLFLQGLLLLGLGAAVAGTTMPRHVEAENRARAEAQAAPGPQPPREAQDDQRAPAAGEDVPLRVETSQANATAPANPSQEEDSWKRTWDMRMKSMELQHGAGKVMTIVIQGVPRRVSEFDIRRRVEEQSKTRFSRSSRKGEDIWIMVGPVDDVDTAATQLKLGTIKNIDNESRTITIIANPALLEDEDDVFGPPPRF